MTKAIAQRLCQLRVDQAWVQGLQPYLEELKLDLALERNYHPSEYLAAKSDIQRITTLNLIDQIIGAVENAEKTLAKLNRVR